MKYLVGQRLEHGPSGQTGLCTDQWEALDGEWVSLLLTGTFKQGKCLAMECRPQRFTPYLAWTNPNKQAAEMTA